MYPWPDWFVLGIYTAPGIGSRYPQGVPRIQFTDAELFPESGVDTSDGSRGLPSKRLNRCGGAKTGSITSGRGEIGNE
jgi:hypothetical protein